MKPMLEGLVYGKSRVFTLQDRSLLATWIAKTTMTAEFLNPKEVAIRQPEEKGFTGTKNLAPIGKSGSLCMWVRNSAGGIFHHGVGIYLPPKPVRIGIKNTQYTVIGFGRFLTFNLSSEQDELTLGLDDRAKAAIYQLWPLTDQDIAWPPSRSIDDQAANAIFGAFGKALRIPSPGR